MKSNPSKALQEQLQIARSGSADEISRFLNSRNSKILEAMLSNPSIPVEYVQILLKKQSLTPNLIILVSERSHWTKNYNVKLDLVLNPVTPRHISLRFVKDLHQNDLATVCRSAALHPAG